MNSPRITYTPRPETTPEAGLNVLASVYRFILFESNGPSKKVAESAPEPSNRDAAARVRNKRR
jgi:hypothetical protein